MLRRRGASSRLRSAPAGRRRGLPRPLSYCWRTAASAPPRHGPNWCPGSLADTPGATRTRAADHRPGTRTRRDGDRASRTPVSTRSIRVSCTTANAGVAHCPSMSFALPDRSTPDRRRTRLLRWEARHRASATHRGGRNRPSRPHVADRHHDRHGPDPRRLYKQLSSQPHMVRDLLDGFADRGWGAALDLDTLTALPASYVGHDLAAAPGRPRLAPASATTAGSTSCCSSSSSPTSTARWPCAC